MYADVDLGAGFGVPVNSCNLADETVTSMDDMFTFKAPSIYDAEIPYYFRVEDQVVPTDTSPTSYTRVRFKCGVTSLTVRARLAYGKGFSRSVLSHRTQRTFNNDIKTYTGGADQGNVRGILSLRGLDKDSGRALWNFIANVVKLNLNKFSIEVLG